MLLFPSIVYVFLLTFCQLAKYIEKILLIEHNDAARTNTVFGQGWQCMF